MSVKAILRRDLFLNGKINLEAGNEMAMAYFNGEQIYHVWVEAKVAEK